MSAKRRVEAQSVANTDLHKSTGIHAAHPYFSYYSLLVHQQVRGDDIFLCV